MIFERYPDISCIYAEDEHVTKEVLRPTLSQLFDELHVVDDGRQALELFKQHPTDLVITDIRMPSMNGLELARALMQLDRIPQIIVTTAYSDSDLIIEAIESGIDHYVLKPIELDQLMQAIAKSVEVINFRKALSEEQQKRDKLLTELQSAMAEIKTLRGFLPICAYCKNVRNDDGYWEKVEDYIHKNAGIDFSHSICPECVKEHFPNYEKDK